MGVIFSMPPPNSCTGLLTASAGRTAATKIGRSFTALFYFRSRLVDRLAPIPRRQAVQESGYLRVLVPIRRLQAQQMMDEEVIALAVAVGAAIAVIRSGNHQQIEGLVRLDQGIHHLHRRRRIDV